jgi:hypothetical protein
VHDRDRLRIWRAPTPGDAKRLGRHIDIRADWDDVKLEVMAFLLVQKFRKGTLLASMLEATGDAYLMEGNHWGDTFWGVCDGEGNNYLGELLMLIREDNRKPRTKQERRQRSFMNPKCWCGNEARKGERFCGRHMPEEELFEGVEDMLPNIMDAS